MRWCVACGVVWYGWDARDRKPCAGKKRGVRLKGSVAVAPTALWWRRLLRYCWDGAKTVASGVESGPCMHDVRFLPLIIWINRLPDGQPATHTNPAARRCKEALRYLSLPPSAS